MLLEGKTGLVFGVANKRSIAWGIAQALAGAGARLAFTYQERVGGNVKRLAATLPDSLTIQCDVQSDEEIQATVDQVDREFDGLDILVHSVAFAPREALDEPFLFTSREAFSTALDISAYSLTGMARAALPLMQKRGGGSIITMTYLRQRPSLPQLQRHGDSQGRTRGIRPISGPQLGRIQHTSERDLGRPDQDARRQGYPGILGYARGRS